ncbi:hypothetical protein [Pseudomonas nitroreducens]|uniref:hypothetical protein n=1 Tax=Pseudomonas nitroreducens TaxID=46680 RepID=UPI00209CB7E0|nr:hypothetical protein [Pseudomonas nitroreducens]MCP1625485.1 hypothetical protein [Pseudomonas nitroreducens]
MHLESAFAVDTLSCSPGAARYPGGGVPSPLAADIRHRLPLARGLQAALLICAALLGGCMSDQEFLAQNQNAALSATFARARFELDCPDVTTSVLSSKVTQVRLAGVSNRTEYTIGARGCGRQAVYITYCLDPDTCNAISDTARVSE